jgi:FSR family fosmidomycin resistance protein-like MFS transporter
LLGVEFINEWFSNLLAALLPAIRAALGLNYIQVSFLLTVLEGTDIISDAIFGVIGDIWSRRLLISAGTIAAGIGLILMGLAPGYLLFLTGVAIQGFAGGPFVGLSQASLMDTHPGRHDRMMAWWSIIGNIGFLVTLLTVAVAYALGVDWRALFAFGGILLIIYALLLTRLRFPRAGKITEGAEEEGEEVKTTSNWAALKAAALDMALLRWALILPLLEIPLNGFAVLYFHDIVGLSNVAASSALLIIIGSSLVGKALLPWLLRYIEGMRLLKFSIWIGVVSFGAFLLVPGILAKFIVLAVFSFVESSWHTLAQAQAYATQPGKSGVVLSVTSLISPVTSFLPLLVGVIATWAGLGWGLAVLLVGPVTAGVLLVFRPA